MCDASVGDWLDYDIDDDIENGPWDFDWYYNSDLNELNEIDGKNS